MIDIIIMVFLFILGSVFASFFGVIVGRVPLGRSIVYPNSHCENCGHELAWYENIPVLSYICLGGKCKECKSPIGIVSLIFEIIGGISLVGVYLVYGLSVKMVVLCVITLLLVLIAYYDKYTNTILDPFWIVLLVVCLCEVIFIEKDYLNSLIGAIVGIVFFGAVKLLGYVFTKKDVLGMGDVIVVGIMGLILKPFCLIFSIMISTFIGSIIELIRIKCSKEKNYSIEIAFCPYLCFGFYVTILFMTQINGLLR